MKSKFSGWAYFVAFYAALFTLILLFCILSDLIFNNILPIYFYLLVNFFVICVWLWAVLGEMRKKVISIEIGYDHLIIKRYLGFGRPETFYFDRVDGYKTSILGSTARLYEYLYIMVGDKKVVKLSEYYHKNYAEIKEMLVASKLKNLGYEDYSSARELKEIFT